MSDLVQQFLAGDSFAVVGASKNPAKFGNKVLRCYQRNRFTVFPVNPREEEIEGLTAYPSLSALPEPVHGISIITPPLVTEAVVEEAAAAGIQFVWMQPGAESDDAIETCRQHGIKVIAGGPCLLVELP